MIGLCLLELPHSVIGACNYVSAILTKLQVRDRAEAAARARGDS